MIAIGKKDIGKKRVHNEDAFFVSNNQFGPLPNLYVVADGMGGHKSGGHASSFAVKILKFFLEEHHSAKLNSDEKITQLFKRAVNHVNYKLFMESKSSLAYEGMGTTLTIATVFLDKIYIAHVGDSRLYIFRNDEICQVTQDHSYVQEMVSKGKLSDEEATDHPKRNIITRAVGTYDKVEVDTYVYSKEDIDYILLCSDGLTTMVTKSEIFKIVINKDNLKEKANKLIDRANSYGGYDNITVILIDLDKAVK